MHVFKLRVCIDWILYKAMWAHIPRLTNKREKKKKKKKKKHTHTHTQRQPAT